MNETCDPAFDDEDWEDEDVEDWEDRYHFQACTWYMDVRD